MTRIEKIELFPISIAYKHVEKSAQVNRSGVSDIVMKITTNDGIYGWGECCSGADIYSVLKAAEAMKPFVLNQSPWSLDEMRKKVYWDGLWQFRKGTANFAWAGYETAILDIQGKLTGEPVYNLLGGAVRDEVNYFYYLSQGTPEDIIEQATDGLAHGFDVFYLKVGVNFENELKMISALRNTIGPDKRIRLDANTSWTLPEAKRNINKLKEYDIDFIEGPIVSDVDAMNELKRHQDSIAMCMNEGLWTREDALARINSLSCDYLNYSPYWVGSFFDFKMLSSLAAMKGIPTCKHTHGEFSIAAVACQHLMVNIPMIAIGNQQTAYIMEDEILTEPIPISTKAVWGKPDGPGLGIEVDDSKLKFYTEKFKEIGQYLPYGSI